MLLFLYSFNYNDNQVTQVILKFARFDWSRIASYVTSDSSMSTLARHARVEYQITIDAHVRNFSV